MFQSTPCGCDGQLKTVPSQPNTFQSPHPCGVRPYIVFPDTIFTYSFNPRTPAGCDAGVKTPAETTIEFQSTHPCGVRLELKQSKAAVEVFQSTHPCGVRLAVAHTCCLSTVFQSTHPCGVRRLGTT